MSLERLDVLRPRALAIAALAGGARTDEDEDEGTIAVSWSSLELEVVLTLGWSDLRIEVPVAGRRGTFFLGYDDEEGAADDAWNGTGGTLFVSRHCGFLSSDSRNEAARFSSLPIEVRRRMIAICEAHRGSFELEDERLALDLTSGSDLEDATLAFGLASDLVRASKALPVAWTSATPALARLHACAHCRSESFVDDGADACPHCGAPA